MNNATFKVNEAEKQFELHIGNRFAALEFYREADKIYLVHTETPEELQGKGVAAELVKQTFQCAKDNGFIVVPACSYVADYVNKHPEWHDILSEGYQM